MEKKYIIISQKAIEEVLWENLMENGHHYFEQNGDDLIYQMVFDKDSCKCIFALTPMNKQLSKKELENLITENDTTASLFEVNGHKFKYLDK